MKSRIRATLIGLIAILLWSSLVGTIKIVSEHLGTIGGIAMIYSVACLLVLCIIGFNKLHEFPIRYLIWGSLLFVSYELCFSLSISFSRSSSQAIEVSMVNYLWPTLTILATVLFNQQKANLLIIPGTILPVIGIGWVLGGDQGLDLVVMLHNISDNPLSYILALCGAFIWAAYCIVTVKYAKGKNGITLFFLLTAVILWIKYLFSNEPSISLDLSTSIYLVLSASAIGFGYAAWNFGMLYGNVTLLAGASYFIPIMSAFLSALLLKTSLSFYFWQGVAMVCLGSTLCWLATSRKK